MIYKINNLYKRYGEHKVIKDVSFSIEEGEVFSILGKNGAGKTTIIKILSNLLSKTSGEVLYNERSLEDLGTSYYNQISVMLEGDRNIYWYLSGIENILYFGRLYGLEDSIILSRSKKLLKKFDLYGDKDKKVGSYSRGMKQKLSLIISLISEPKVIFLDEPTLGLDAISKRILIDTIKELSREKNITIILTSHQLDIIEDLSDRIMLLDEGEILYMDSTSNLVNLYSQNIYELSYNGEEVINLPKEINLLNVKEQNGNINLRLECSKDEIQNIFNYLFNNDFNVNYISRNDMSLEDVIIKLWTE